MSKRYIVEYFVDNTVSDAITPQAFFVEAESVADAKAKCVERCGAFVDIVSAKLTKSSASSTGDLYVPPKVTVEKPTESRTDESKKTKAPSKVKTEKAPKTTKEPKVTNASRIREQVVIAKRDGKDQASVIAWAMETLSQSAGTAKAYVKAIWAE